MGKIVEKKQQKFAAILNAAFELFIEKGFEKTSVSDISEKAGIAKGTFYLYFADKNDVRDTLVSAKATELFSRAVEAMEQSGTASGFEDKVIFITEYLIDRLCSQPDIMTFIYKNLNRGTFVNALNEKKTGDIDPAGYFRSLSEEHMENGGIMVFLIAQLIKSACYSSVIYGSPVGINELKPYLYGAVRSITASFRRDGENALQADEFIVGL